jgi:hypothetical protein
MTAGSGLVERYGHREIEYNKILILGKKSSDKNRHYRFRVITRAGSPESRAKSGWIGGGFPAQGGQSPSRRPDSLQ